MLVTGANRVRYCPTNPEVTGIRLETRSEFITGSRYRREEGSEQRHREPDQEDAECDPGVQQAFEPRAGR